MSKKETVQPEEELNNNNEAQAETTAEEQASTENGASTAEDTEETAKEETVDDWKDKYMRLYSEFDNYRKRSNREKIDLIKNASGDIMKNLLPILDDFERAIKANESSEDLDGLREGFKLIHGKLESNLAKNGLKPMDSIGKPFDVDHHEAITEIPAPSEDLKGKVVDAVEKGYFLNDKVLRYAKVVVGK